MHPVRTDYGPVLRPEHGQNDWLFAGVAIIFWAVIIFGLVVLISKFSHYMSSKTLPPIETPLDIAKSRYARGDITKDEFSQLKKDLS
jgi:putative membrane protein